MRRLLPITDGELNTLCVVAGIDVYMDTELQHFVLRGRIRDLWYERNLIFSATEEQWRRTINELVDTMHRITRDSV